MTTLLALELALCCSNVTYRQPGNIYGNAIAFAAAVYSKRASLSKLHCSHCGHVNNLEYYGNYLKRYIETRNDMRYVRMYVRTPYAQTNSPLNTLVWGSLTLAQLIKYVTHLALIKFINMLIFPMVVTGINRRGVSL